MRKYRIADAHCHIYPDKIAEKAAEGTGKFYDIKMRFDGKADTLKEICRKSEIKKCLIQSVATTPKQVSSINRFIAGEVEKSEGLFVGFGTLHPLSENIDGDIEELISLKLRGVKLHPDIQGFAADDPKCVRIYEKIAGKLPLLIHCGDCRYDMSNPNRIGKVIDGFPNMTVIAAHLGGYTMWEKAAETYAGKRNVFVDTSSSFPFLTDEQIKKYIKAYGAEKVLFGTDYPMWNVEDDLERLFSLGLTEKEYEMILYENFERLLGE